MLAAGLRPQAVRSLALIEPSWLRVAAHDPPVVAALERMREGIGSLPEDISYKEFTHLSTEPLDIEVPAPTPLMLRNAQNAMRKTQCAKRYARAAQLGGRGACATVGVGSVAKVGDQWKLGERFPRLPSLRR
jgi:hypothetical protein